MGREKKENAARDLEVEPPDSGWAWIVLGSLVIVHVMIVGFLASVSVYVHVWITYFDGSAAETSLVISLCAFMTGALSPIAGSVCKRLGPRVTTMVGGTMTSLGMAVSSQSTSIIFLIISLGLFTALGMSMSLNAGFTSLGTYFKKRIALAIGLATAGTSIGQLALPPLFQYLIDQYGWRGSLLITSALAFHVAAAGALMRPLVPKKRKRSSKPTKRISRRGDKVSDSSTGKSCQSTEVGSPGLSFLNPSIFGGEDFACSRGDTALGEGSIFQGEPDLAMTTDETPDEDRIEYADADSWSLSSAPAGYITVMNNNAWVPVAETTLGHHGKRRRRTPLVPGRRGRSASMLSQTLVKHTSDVFLLLHNPSFLLMLVAALAHGFGWASTTYHLVSRAESVNIAPDNAALLLTLMGAGSFFGRLAIGWVVDRHWIRPELYHTSSFAVCALATFVTPLVTGFNVLAAVALIHGLSTGAATVVIFMVARIVVEPPLAPTSTAYFFLALGVGEISGGALAGWFYDALKSYDYSFYAAGSVMTAGSGIMLIIYFLQRAKQRRQALRTIRTEEQAGAGAVQPGSNQFDPELAGSKGDDLGRVNPVFFMRQRFETQCESEIVVQSGPVMGDVDVDPTSRSCQSHLAHDGEVRKSSPEVGSLREGCSDGGESLAIEDPACKNELAEAQLYTRAEVHEQETAGVEIPSSVNVAGTSPQIKENLSKRESGDEEGVVSFENPWYENDEVFGAVERSDDASLESNRDQENSGIENQLYFAETDLGECFPYDPESVISAECWDGASVTDSVGEYASEMEVTPANHWPVWEGTLDGSEGVAPKSEVEQNVAQQSRGWMGEKIIVTEETFM